MGGTNPKGQGEKFWIDGYPEETIVSNTLAGNIDSHQFWIDGRPICLVILASSTQSVTATSVEITVGFGTPTVALASGDQVVTASGVPVYALLGDIVVTPQAVSVAPESVSSYPIVGEPTVTIQYRVSPSSVISYVVVGQPTIIIEQFITASSIASYGVIGDASVSQNITAVGDIESYVLFGEAKLVHTVEAPSIVSYGACGTPTVVPGAVEISPDGVPSYGVVGIPNVVQHILATSTSAYVAFGYPELKHTIRPTPIYHNVVFGSPKITVHVTDTGGIASYGIVGEPRVVQHIRHIDGIQSVPAFGVPSLTMHIAPFGIGVTPKVDENTIVWRFGRDVILHQRAILSYGQCGIPSVSMRLYASSVLSYALCGTGHVVSSIGIPLRATLTIHTNPQMILGVADYDSVGGTVLVRSNQQKEYLVYGYNSTTMKVKANDNACF